MSEMSEMLVATRTFMAVIDGKRVKVMKGKTRVRADHSLVKGREALFKPADAVFADVEDTTARPGSRRGDSDRPTRKRTAKKAAAKKTAAKKTTAKKAAAKKAPEAPPAAPPAPESAPEANAPENPASGADEGPDQES